MDSTILAFNTNYYTTASAYHEYLSNKVANEEAMAEHLKQYIPVNEAAYKNLSVVTEGAAQDKIKAKWNKFSTFIKNLIGKFMEAMTKLLLDEKGYLEKYKDIILNKKPKKGMKYSYTGDYKKAIDRCINTPVPVFNYDKYSAELKQEGDTAVINKIMAGKDFTFDEGKTLAEQFKSYFLSLESGQSEGEFSDLNFTDMYNFCYNFKQIENITKKDETFLRQSTEAIINAINIKLRQQQSSQPDNVETNPENTNEAASIFSEADGDDKKSTGLSINTDAVSQMKNYNDSDNPNDENKTGQANSAASNNETEKEITAMSDKWVRICQAIITAKCTAVQQIAKDYMTIIRAHVRSYVGTNDKKDDKSADKATDYKKENNKAEDDNK